MAVNSPIRVKLFFVVLIVTCFIIGVSVGVHGQSGELESTTTIITIIASILPLGLLVSLVALVITQSSSTRSELKSDISELSNRIEGWRNSTTTRVDDAHGRIDVAAGAIPGRVRAAEKAALETQERTARLIKEMEAQMERLKNTVDTADNVIKELQGRSSKRR